MNMIQFFDENNSTVELAGGKGLNLALLTKAGFPVPPGFIITTKFYKLFIQENNLDRFISEKLEETPSNDYNALELLSKTIRDRFAECNLPPELLKGISDAYKKLGSPPVAVRSSATTEDTINLSYAGQHDTILNIVDSKSLIPSIIECMSSLFTARAIYYRRINHISSENLALAVVVQQLIASEISGVLFTVNPLTEKRSEYVIDATFGLGDALVSGQIEPDHYVIDTITNKIIDQKVGSKKFSLLPKLGGGIQSDSRDVHKKSSLDELQIKQLTILGKKVENYFHSPQDIEWAFADGTLYLIQSRPVTTLYPLTKDFLKGPPQVYLSFGAVQGMLEPMTPLGRDNITHFILSVAKLFASKLTYKTQKFLWHNGERIWMDFTSALTHVGLRSITTRLLTIIDPVALEIFQQLLSEKFLQKKKRPPFSAIKHLIRFLIFMLPQFRKMILDPINERENRYQFAEKFVNLIQQKSQKITTPLEIFNFYTKWMERSGKYVLTSVIPIIALGYLPLSILSILTGNDSLPLEFTRSLSFNPTTRMNLMLGKIAAILKEDPELLFLFKQTDSDELTKNFLNESLPKIAQNGIKKFISAYGFRGLAEIDLGRERWNEQPKVVIDTIKSYMLLTDDESPDSLFKKGRKSTYIAYHHLYSLVRKSRFGYFKAKILNFFFYRIRNLAGFREYPKFVLVRMFWIFHSLFLKLGSLFVKDGIINKPSDIFFIHYEEIEKILKEEMQNWKKIIEERKESFDREKLRKLVPRVIANDGRVFYTSSASDEQLSLKKPELLIGSPVSPGVVEGYARIVHNPYKSELKSGEILVCPATDPSWTPLFLIAKGLIMEVGGMMVHGAVIAREHNIPAVVSVVNATTLIKTGQLLRVNGSTGQITIIDKKSASK